MGTVHAVPTDLPFTDTPRTKEILGSLRALSHLAHNECTTFGIPVTRLKLSIKCVEVTDMQRRAVSRDAIKRAAKWSTKASAQLERRTVPDTFVRSQSVERFLEERRQNKSYAKKLRTKCSHSSLKVLYLLDDLLSDYFLRNLHRRMYGDIWNWAGLY